MMRLPILCALISLLTLSSAVEYKPPPPVSAYVNVADYAPPMVLSLYGYTAPSTFAYAATMEKWYSIPDYLLRALMYWESGGLLHSLNKNANGSRDDGPLQYNSRYIKQYETWFNNGESFDPCSLYSIQIGARELVSNHAAQGSWKDAIQLHNKGEKGYSDRVLKVYLRFNGLL
jgi:hypothetical protein